MKNQNNKTKMLASAGVMIALAQILSYMKLFRMPQGGTVTPGKYVPLILFALIYGGKSGCLLGFVFGILQFVLDGGQIYHPLSLLLDYFVAFSVVGVAGFFNKSYLSAIRGTILAMLLSFCSFFLSGWLVFGSYAPEGQAPWLYSLIYNASYMLPETIITIILISILYKPLKKALKF